MKKKKLEKEWNDFLISLAIWSWKINFGYVILLTNIGKCIFYSRNIYIYVSKRDRIEWESLYYAPTTTYNLLYSEQERIRRKIITIEDSTRRVKKEKKDFNKILKCNSFSFLGAKSH